jgi:hypothetical protein
MAFVVPNGLKGLRDRAALLLGFSGAFRRDEFVALDVADLEETEDGYRVRRLGQIDSAIEEAAKRGRTNAALSAIDGQRKARVALADLRQHEGVALADLRPDAPR